LKISSITIERFRSIEKCKLTLDTINAIVGQNNSGKSAIIRALNAFFNRNEEKNSFYSEKHQYNQKSIPKITCKFINIGSNDSFYSYTQNDTLELRLSYHKNKGLKYTYKKDNKFISAPDELIKKVKNNISFVYIPPNRSSDQLEWEENSLIKKLVVEFLKKETNKRDNLTPQFKPAIRYLESNALKKIAKSLEEIYSLRNKFNFTLSFNKDNNFQDFLNGIEMSVTEYGITHHIDDCGTGLQSLSIISLHRILAQLNQQNIILGIEEPEKNLHPQAQKEFVRSIKKSSQNKKITQAIFTTHSSAIIDSIKHDQITMVRKEPDEGRGFKSNIYKIKDSFFDDYGLEEAKYYHFHDYRNSDFFYANYVIFVESKNDALIVNYLAKLEDIDLGLLGISIINIEGVNNLPYPFYTVKELKIPYLLILDKDFFIPYQFDSFDKSIGKDGLPRYKYEYKTERRKLIYDLIDNKKDREQILKTMKTNYSRTLDLFMKHNIVCMNYNLEIDLLCSEKAVQIMSTLLNLPNDNRKLKYLVSEKKKAIKKPENILSTLEELNNRNLPNSYKRIKKKLTELAKVC